MVVLPIPIPLPASNPLLNPLYILLIPLKTHLHVLAGWGRDLSKTEKVVTDRRVMVTLCLALELGGLVAFGVFVVVVRGEGQLGLDF